ncbi:hypothetical protein F2Q69_00009363, partial [Brassica cretica]
VIGAVCYGKDTMASSHRFSSAPMADTKGKGILYEEEDEPIQLVEDDDPHTIREFSMSLIGKILNPKKQNVEKLIKSMPTQWGMQDKIMRMTLAMEGIPLHLWTVKNLKRIGGKLGHIDTMELAAGRLLVDVDTRKPLIFTKKVQSPGGDEVSIQFTYDRLFKHCSYCGFLTHEAANCTKKMEDQRQQAKEAGVFSRVQLPFEPQNRQSLLEDRTRRDLYHSHRDRKNDTWKDHEAVKPATAAYSRSSHENRDRVEHDYSERRHERLVERPLRRPGDNWWSHSGSCHIMELGHHDDTYQDRSLKIAEESSGNENAPRGSGKKLASTIVSPYHASNENDVNVTFRSKSSTRAIDFSPMENVTRDIDFSHMENEMHNNDLNKGQIIEALHDMDIGGSSVGAQLHDASMDVDATDDDDVDLLGEELKEMEEPHHIASSSNEVARGSKARSSNKGPSRHGILRGMPVRKQNSFGEVLQGNVLNPLSYFSLVVLFRSGYPDHLKLE